MTQGETPYGISRKYEIPIQTVIEEYRTGHFARNKLAVASGYTLKATDEEELRKAGILLSSFS